MPVEVKRNLAKSPNWYARGTLKVWKDGQSVTVQVDESTGTPDKDEAEGIRDQIVQRVRAQNINNQAPEPSFNDLAVEYLEGGGCGRFLLKILDVFENWPVSAITDSIIEREGRKVYPNASDETRWRQWRTPIKAVLNVRSRRPKRPIQNRRTDFFTPGEFDKLAIALKGARFDNPWGPAIGHFLVGTGARAGEMLSVDGRDDIKLEYGMAALRDPKNGEERWVELPRRTIAAISVLPNLGEPGPLFRRHDGKPYTRYENRGGEIRRMFATAVEAIGLDPRIYTPHVCRHTWATWFYACTRDVLRLRALGGWKSNEWERYTKIAPSGLKDDIERRGWEFSGKQTAADEEFGKKANDLR